MKMKERKKNKKKVTLTSIWIIIQ